MLLGGGTTLDFWPPMRAIFQHIRDLDKDPRVLAASVMMVHPWNDHKELGWSTLVTTDGQPELADRLADELAERAWEVRHSLPPRFKTAEEAIRLAREARLGRKLGVVVMADVSDVVTAGAPGDNTRLLSALLRDGSDLTAYVPLRDPALVDELWGKHQPGDVVTVVVGGKLDPKRGVPIELTAKIHGMPRAHGVERMVVLENGGVKLVVTEGPAFAIRPAFYETAGLSVMAADVVIVKNFFPFLMFFLPYSRKTLFRWSDRLRRGLRPRLRRSDPPARLGDRVASHRPAPAQAGQHQARSSRGNAVPRSGIGNPRCHWRARGWRRWSSPSRWPSPSRPPSASARPSWPCRWGRSSCRSTSSCRRSCR
jgi:hypothetical protein